MVKIHCSTEEEVDELARKTAGGYIGLRISLSEEDIKHLLEGGYIYEVCNLEYGVSIEARELPRGQKEIVRDSESVSELKERVRRSKRVKSWRHF